MRRPHVPVFLSILFFFLRRRWSWQRAYPGANQISHPILRNEATVISIDSDKNPIDERFQIESLKSRHDSEWHKCISTTSGISARPSRKKLIRYKWSRVHSNVVGVGQQLLCADALANVSCHPLHVLFLFFCDMGWLKAVCFLFGFNSGVKCAQYVPVTMKVQIRKRSSIGAFYVHVWPPFLFWTVRGVLIK